MSPPRHRYMLANTGDGYGGPEWEVPVEAFIAAEQQEGFSGPGHATGEPATAGFHGHKIRGRIAWDLSGRPAGDPGAGPEDDWLGRLRAEAVTTERCRTCGAPPGQLCRDSAGAERATHYARTRSVTEREFAALDQVAKMSDPEAIVLQEAVTVTPGDVLVIAIGAGVQIDLQRAAAVERHILTQCPDLAGVVLVPGRQLAVYRPYEMTTAPPEDQGKDPDHATTHDR